MKSIFKFIYTTISSITAFFVSITASFVGGGIGIFLGIIFLLYKLLEYTLYFSTITLFIGYIGRYLKFNEPTDILYSIISLLSFVTIYKVSKILNKKIDNFTNPITSSNSISTFDDIGNNSIDLNNRQSPNISNINAQNNPVNMNSSHYDNEFTIISSMRVGGYNPYTDQNFTQEDIDNIFKLNQKGKDTEPSRVIRMINDCESIAKESTNLDTIIYRLEFAQEKILNLQELENYNLYNKQPNSRYFIDKLITKQDDILKNAILRSYEKTKNDAQKLKTEKGKLNRIEKFFLNLEKYNDVLSPSIKTYINSFKNRDNIDITQEPNTNRSNNVVISSTSINYPITGTINPSKNYNVNDLEIKFFNALYESLSNVDDNNDIELIRMSTNGRLKIHFRGYPLGSIRLQGRKHYLHVLTTNYFDGGYSIETNIDDFIDEIPAIINYITHLKDTSIENWSRNSEL